MAQAAYASETSGVSSDTAFIFNSLLFLIGGILVMWMAAGFCMLEAGLVRTKNVGVQCTKNIAIYSVAALTYGFVGYHLMYPGDSWVMDKIIGMFQVVNVPAAGAGALSDGDYSIGSDFFFQMTFCATTASIVSGTIAERVKFSTFVVFTIILTALIYPIVGSWQWGAGWLADAGFSDFAGSTIVHSVGGWAAVAAVLMIGARYGRFSKTGKSNPMRASNLPLATLGTFILWMGWFGFNGASQLAMGSISDVSDISRIFLNTNTAAAAGAVGSMLLCHIVLKQIDLTMVLNGALGGLVAITAEPLMPSFLWSVSVGLIASVIVFYAVIALDRLKIDDVVGAIPVHLMCGIFGTLIVPVSNNSVAFSSQILGVVAVGVFTLAASFIAWTILKFTLGLRPAVEHEVRGLDKTEMGMEAYPEFIAH